MWSFLLAFFCCGKLTYRQSRSGVAQNTVTPASKTCTLRLRHMMTFNRASFLLKHSSTFICYFLLMTLCRWTGGCSTPRPIRCQYYTVLWTRRCLVTCPMRLLQLMNDPVCRLVIDFRAVRNFIFLRVFPILRESEIWRVHEGGLCRDWQTISGVKC